MASERRQAQTRIRRTLQINSYDLSAFEHYLIQEGFVPDSTNEQAASDTVFRLRKLCDQPGHIYPLNGGKSLGDLFSAASGTGYGAAARESESIKYDAIEDLILMLAVRKAQNSATQEQQSSRGSDAAVKAKCA
jgi:hypothetical protein